MGKLFHKFYSKRKRGFTLIEILVVVVILGALTAIAIPTYNKIIRKSRVSDGLNSIEMLASAQEKYFVQHGQYSQSLTLLNAPFKDFRIQDPNSPFSNIITTNFTYDKNPQKHCIEAVANGKDNYTLVKNYRRKDKVVCKGPDCGNISDYVGEINESAYQEICPNEIFVPGISCDQEGAVEYVMTEEHCGGWPNGGGTNSSQNSAIIVNGSDPKSSVPNGNDPNVFVACGLLHKERKCNSGTWVYTGNTQCSKMQCALPLILNAENCSCVKGCSFPQPTASELNCPIPAVQGNSPICHPNEDPQRCGVLGDTVKVECNLNTSNWECVKHHNDCTEVTGDVGQSCDGVGVVPNATQGNTCGIKEFKSCGYDDAFHVVVTTSCNKKSTSACFDGEYTSEGCPEGEHKFCQGCQWGNCVKCAPPITQPNPIIGNPSSCEQTSRSCQHKIGWFWLPDYNTTRLKPGAVCKAGDTRTCPYDSSLVQSCDTDSCNWGNCCDPATKPVPDPVVGTPNTCSQTSYVCDNNGNWVLDPNTYPNSVANAPGAQCHNSSQSQSCTLEDGTSGIQYCDIASCAWGECLACDPPEPEPSYVPNTENCKVYKQICQKEANGSYNWIIDESDISWAESDYQCVTGTVEDCYIDASDPKAANNPCCDLGCQTSCQLNFAIMGYTSEEECIEGKGGRCIGGGGDPNIPNGYSGGCCTEDQLRGCGSNGCYGCSNWFYGYNVNVGYIEPDAQKCNQCLTSLCGQGHLYCGTQASVSVGTCSGSSGGGSCNPPSGGCPSGTVWNSSECKCVSNGGGGGTGGGTSGSTTTIPIKGKRTCVDCKWGECKPDGGCNPPLGGCPSGTVWDQSVCDCVSTGSACDPSTKPTGVGIKACHEKNGVTDPSLYCGTLTATESICIDGTWQWDFSNSSCENVEDRSNESTRDCWNGCGEQRYVKECKNYGWSSGDHYSWQYVYSIPGNYSSNIVMEECHLKPGNNCHDDSGLPSGVHCIQCKKARCQNSSSGWGVVYNPHTQMCYAEEYGTISAYASSATPSRPEHWDAVHGWRPTYASVKPYDIRLCASGVKFTGYPACRFKCKNDDEGDGTPLQPSNIYNYETMPNYCAGPNPNVVGVISYSVPSYIYHPTGNCSGPSTNTYYWNDTFDIERTKCRLVGFTLYNGD